MIALTQPVDARDSEIVTLKLKLMKLRRQKSTDVQVIALRQAVARYKCLASFREGQYWDAVQREATLRAKFARARRDMIRLQDEIDSLKHRLKED